MMKRMVQKSFDMNCSGALISGSFSSINSNFEGPGWVLRIREISARRVPLRNVPHSHRELWCAQYIRTRREPTFAHVLQREMPRTVANTSIDPIHSTGMVHKLLMLYFELLYVPYRKGSQSCLASANQSEVC